MRVVLRRLVSNTSLVFFSREHKKLAGGPARVIEASYDSRACALENFKVVSSALDKYGVEHVQLPSSDVYEPTLVVSSGCVHQLDMAMTEILQGPGWVYEIEETLDRRIRRFISRIFKISPLDPLGINIDRRTISPTGTLLNTKQERVNIQIWNRLPGGVKREDGGHHAEGTLHPQRTHKRQEVAYITPMQWQEAQAEPSHKLNVPHPLIYEVTEPIDLVYTWVDGSEKDWQHRKHLALEAYELTDVNLTANNESRFSVRDELKYSLRSVEMYANWVNHIYIVTDSQVPEWLNLSNPKISVIDHRDIYDNSSYLPVFNSHAIESQLHHIPGLSDKYIYMNDDIFMARPTSPSLFFHSNGLAKFFLSIKPIDTGDVLPEDYPVVSAAKNGRSFIQKHFGLTVTHKFRHTPHPQSKSVLTEMERDFPQLFEAVAASKLRHPDDYSIASSLQHHYAYATGRAVPATISYGYVDIASADIEHKLEHLDRRQLDVFCLNETYFDKTSKTSVNEILWSFLESRFPVPSSFEVL